ncbi:hypothetical protein E2C01_023481 [Portunus trituberculatus]|uniref:Uncharacterized protein n=1 Tax=Portunus trituberculatus TaxID=210409 RepID=A0A5B7E8B3_PORTR|nr:hypothetical protein [Portunus trituberculatus]
MHLPHTHTHFTLNSNRNVPRSDCSPNGDPKYLDTSLIFFFINVFNIPGLRSNFQSIEHTSLLLNLIFFSSPKHSCLRQLTVVPSLFPPTSSILILPPKLDVAQRFNLLSCPRSLIFRVFHRLASTQ